MSCCEAFFVIGDGVNKIEILIPWVELVQAYRIHSELYVGFPLILFMDS